MLANKEREGAHSNALFRSRDQSGTSADTHTPSACMLISSLIMSTVGQTIPNWTIVTKGAVFEPQEFRVQIDLLAHCSGYK